MVTSASPPGCSTRAPSTATSPRARCRTTTSHCSSRPDRHRKLCSPWAVAVYFAGRMSPCSSGSRTAPSSPWTRTATRCHSRSSGAHHGKTSDSGSTDTASTRQLLAHPVFGQDASRPFGCGVPVFLGLLAVQNSGNSSVRICSNIKKSKYDYLSGSRILVMEFVLRHFALTNGVIFAILQIERRHLRRHSHSSRRIQLCSCD